MKPQSIPLDVLSFVDMPQRRKEEGPPRFWVVTPSDEYVDASQKGHEYAIELAQYFKLKPQWVGANTLINIVGSMDLEDHTRTHGYGDPGRWVHDPLPRPGRAEGGTAPRCGADQRGAGEHAAPAGGS